MAYLKLIRIHTLLLAFASISVGILLAIRDGGFSWNLSILILLTAISLQIVANIANDYGDGVRKIDGGDRIGFERMMQSGKISKRAIAINIFLAVLCGLLLALLDMAYNCLYYLCFIFCRPLADPLL